MNDQNKGSIPPRLQKGFDELKAAPARDPRTAARARARFLSEAVSMREEQRPSGWKLTPRKERFAMNIIVSALVIAGLLFGGGATAYAAQDDLPNETLYPVKTWSEDVRLLMEGNPQGQIERLMQLAQIRVNEMIALQEQGVIPPDSVELRLQQHIEQALQIAAGLDDAAMAGELQQIQDQLRIMEQDMTRAQTQDGSAEEPIMLRTRDMLQLHIHQAEDGITDPQGFRNNSQNGFRRGQTESAASPAGSEPASTPEPGGNGYGGPNANPTNALHTPSPNQDGSGQQGNPNPGGDGQGGGGGQGPGGGGQGGRP